MLYLKFNHSIQKVMHFDMSLCRCYWLAVKR